VIARVHTLVCKVAEAGSFGHTNKLKLELLLLNPKYENERRQNDNATTVVYGGAAVDRGGGDFCGVGAAFEPETNGPILCGSAWPS